MFEKTLDLICRAFTFLMVACLALMVVMVFGNVVLRYGFNSGIAVSEELSRWLFVWMTFLGAVVAVRNRAHLGTDMVIAKLSLTGRKVCFFLAHLLMLGVCWLMFQGAWKQAQINMGTTSAVMQASMGWFYMGGVIFAVFAALILAHEMWKLMTGQLQKSELIGLTESDDMPHGNPESQSAAAPEVRR